MATARTLHKAKLMITFAHIAATGSISATADHLRRDKGAISRQLRELEEMLDARLMHRSARGMVLTDVGALVYERAQRVLQEVENAELDAQMQSSQPRGVLTVSASVAFGKLLVVPLLPDFMQRYPQLDVQLCLLDRHVDMVEEGVDVLLRLCDAPPDNLVARHLFAIDYAVVATPQRLAPGPAIRSPADLASHQCLFYGYKNRRSTWRFTRAGQSIDVPVTTRVAVNSSEAVRDLALQGAGIALLPCLAIAADLQAGRLERLLPDYDVRGQLGTQLYALYLPGRAMSPKISCFVEFVRERWSGGATGL